MAFVARDFPANFRAAMYPGIGVSFCVNRIKLEKREAQASAVALSKDTGKEALLAIGYFDGTVCLHSESGKFLREIRLKEEAQAIRFTHWGKFMAAGLKDQVVIIETESGKTICEIAVEGGHRFVYPLAVTTKADHVAVASAESPHHVLVYDVHSRLIGRLARTPAADDIKSRALIRANDIAFGPYGSDVLAIGHVDGRVTEWSYRKNELLGNKIKFPATHNEISSVRYNPDDNWLACGGKWGKLRFETKSGPEFLDYTHHGFTPGCIRDIAFGREFFSGPKLAAYTSGDFSCFSSVNIARIGDGHPKRLFSLSHHTRCQSGDVDMAEITFLDREHKGGLFDPPPPLTLLVAGKEYSGRSGGEKQTPFFFQVEIYDIHERDPDEKEDDHDVLRCFPKKVVQSAG